MECQPSAIQRIDSDLDLLPKFRKSNNIQQKNQDNVSNKSNLVVYLPDKPEKTIASSTNLDSIEIV